MDDQNRPDHDDTAPVAGRPDGADRDWSAQRPAPSEPTRTLPPMTASPAAPAPARRARTLSAAVLVGALVLGGAAGVGGAAWYDAWQGDEPAAGVTTGSDSQPVTATNATAPLSVQAVADKVLPSVVKINVTGQTAAGSGSGIILSEDGEILTNNHVVALAEGGGSITVNFNDGKTLRAKIVGTDPVTDIAVIKAEGAEGLQPATIGRSGSLEVGQPVVAVGSPYGLNATVTSGIVSALNRPVSVAQETPEQPENPFGFGFPQQQEQQPQSTTYPAIQTDAAINPGNSGGPLVDMAGRVVGINSSIRTANGGSSGSIGLGFAIPIDEVLPIVHQIRNGEIPTHARMAVTVSTAQVRQLAQGAVIRSVEDGGPADQAGLQPGDLITKVDGEVIDGSESLVATIRGHRPGDEVEITFLRGKDTRTATVTLGSDEKTTAS